MAAETQTLVPGKIFIGGLSQNTTDETLRNALTTHALCAPVDCHVMMDGKTARSRGFGFAVFASPANAKMVVQTQPIVIDGREVTVSECWEKGAAPSTRTEVVPAVPAAGAREQLKIFVGGLSQFTTKESLDTYFAQFGYADSYIMMDKASGRSRGFGFVNFQEELALASVLQMNHEIDGVPVTVSLYEPAVASASRASVGYAETLAPQPAPTLPVATELPQGPGSLAMVPTTVPTAARDQLKIFVGGLSQVTTKQSLDEYFSQFGYADSFIMTDRATGRSRGFGFVNFSDRQVMDQVLSMVHEVDGVQITSSPYQGNFNPSRSSGGSLGYGPVNGGALAAPTTTAPPALANVPANTAPGPLTSDPTAALTASLLSQVEEKLQGAVLNAVGQQQEQYQQQQPQYQQLQQPQQPYQQPQQKPSNSTGQLKIFVGGLAQHTTKESLDAYFSQFGHANSYIMMDKASGRSRGFGFVNFSDEQVMSTVLSFQHEVDGAVVTCNQYEDRSATRHATGTGRGPALGNDASATGHAGSAATTSLGSTAVEILNNTILMISKLRGQVESQAAQQAQQGQLQQQQQQQQQQQPYGTDLGLQSTMRSGVVKLFIGGLAPTTTSELLVDAFAPYGCTEAEVVTDKFTGRSRCFGFVSFSSPGNAEAAMQVQHMVDGRQVEVSECWEKGAPSARKTGGPAGTATGGHRAAPY